MVGNRSRYDDDVIVLDGENSNPQSRASAVFERVPIKTPSEAREAFLSLQGLSDVGRVAPKPKPVDKGAHKPVEHINIASPKLVKRNNIDNLKPMFDEFGRPMHPSSSLFRASSSRSQVDSNNIVELSSDDSDGVNSIARAVKRKRAKKVVLNRSNKIVVPSSPIPHQFRDDVDYLVENQDSDDCFEVEPAVERKHTPISFPPNPVERKHTPISFPSNPVERKPNPTSSGQQEIKFVDCPAISFSPSSSSRSYEREDKFLPNQTFPDYDDENDLDSFRRDSNDDFQIDEDETFRDIDNFRRDSNDDLPNNQFGMNVSSDDDYQERNYRRHFFDNKSLPFVKLNVPISSDDEEELYPGRNRNNFFRDSRMYHRVESDGSDEDSHVRSRLLNYDSDSPPGGIPRKREPKDIPSRIKRSKNKPTVDNNSKATNDMGGERSRDEVKSVNKSKSSRSEPKHCNDMPRSSKDTKHCNDMPRSSKDKCKSSTAKHNLKKLRELSKCSSVIQKSRNDYIDSEISDESDISKSVPGKIRKCSSTLIKMFDNKSSDPDFSGFDSPSEKCVETKSIISSSRVKNLEKVKQSCESKSNEKRKLENPISPPKKYRKHSGSNFINSDCSPTKSRKKSRSSISSSRSSVSSTSSISSLPDLELTENDVSPIPINIQVKIGGSSRRVEFSEEKTSRRDSPSKKDKNSKRDSPSKKDKTSKRNCSSGDNKTSRRDSSSKKDKNNRRESIPKDENISKKKKTFERSSSLIVNKTSRREPIPKDNNISKEKKTIERSSLSKENKTSRREPIPKVDNISKEKKTIERSSLSKENKTSRTDSLSEDCKTSKKKKSSKRESKSVKKRTRFRNLSTSEED